MINYIFAFYYPAQAKIFHRLGHLTRYLHALFNTSLSEWGLYLPNSSRFDKCLSKVKVVIGCKNFFELNIKVILYYSGRLYSQLIYCFFPFFRQGCTIVSNNFPFYLKRLDIFKHCFYPKSGNLLNWFSSCGSAVMRPLIISREHSLQGDMQYNS